MATQTLPECPAGARLVPLTKGRFAIVDEEDYPIVMAWHWQYHYGYATGSYKSRMHRLVLGNPGPGVLVDHINLDTLDNRKANLRLATFQQNTQHRSSSNKTGFKGVFRHGERFAAMINGLHIGLFGTAREAALAYDAAAREKQGEFAHPNFPDESIPLVVKAEKSSRFPGVFYVPRLNRWESRFMFKGKSYFLSTHATEQEAYDAAVKKRKEVGAPQPRKKHVPYI